MAPAIVTYLWSGTALGGIGWIAALAYATCCGLRLARFNVTQEDPDRPAWASNYFTGTAAPAAAGLALMPMFISFQIGDTFFRHPVAVGIWLLVVAFFMVSRIPTYSFKHLSVKREHVLATLVLVALGAAPSSPRNNTNASPRSRFARLFPYCKVAASSFRKTLWLI